MEDGEGEDTGEDIRIRQEMGEGRGDEGEMNRELEELWKRVRRVEEQREKGEKRE